MSTLLPVITTLVALVASFFMDRALRSIRIYTAQTLTPTAWFLGGLVITFLFVVILLTSVWMIALRNRTPRWVGLLIAVLALLLFLGLPIAASGLFPFGENIFHQPFLPSELLLLEAAPDSFFMIQTIALLISGLYALIRPKQA